MTAREEGGQHAVAEPEHAEGGFLQRVALRIAAWMERWFPDAFVFALIAVWMLPVLGVLGLRARHVIGFTFVQFLVHFPIVLVLVWLLAGTLDYEPPVIP
ncbi:hypothetical protein ACWEFL_05685 [Streptomyces sp. NPDC004838]